MASGVVSVNYEALQKVAQGFGEQQRQVQRINRNVTESVEVLKRGGWVADAANQFYRTMDQDVLRSMQRLNTALGHSQAATLDIIRVFRQAEEEASGVMRGEGGTAGTGGTGVGIGGTSGQFGDGSVAPQPITNQPWYTLNSDADGGWNGAPPGVAQAIVVNGIQNDQSGLQGLMQGASKEFGGIPVMGIYNATAGKSLVGMWDDAKQTFFDKFQAQLGFRPGPDNKAVNSLVEAIKATNGQTPIVAHSQGGAITAAALRKLSDEGFDLSHLKVTTMGSAEFHFPPGPQYEHRVHADDVVPMLVGGKMEYYYFNPLSLAKHLLTGEVKIAPVSGVKTFLDDTHSAESYFNDF